VKSVLKKKDDGRAPHQRPGGAGRDERGRGHGPAGGAGHRRGPGARWYRRTGPGWAWAWAWAWAGGPLWTSVGRGTVVLCAKSPNFHGVTTSSRKLRLP
jgi:hypothetical protein